MVELGLCHSNSMADLITGHSQAFHHHCGLGVNLNGRNVGAVLSKYYLTLKWEQYLLPLHGLELVPFHHATSPLLPPRPSVLDSFSSLSGHTSNLMKQLCGERMPPLHTRVILPLMVSSDKDFELEVMNWRKWLRLHSLCVCPLLLSVRLNHLV
jgi:hypothetical protein